jgi:Spy/CpxP family protein refolding chaperone
MSYFKNRGFWFWGFIILVLINISILGSMAYVMYRVHNQPDYTGFHHHFMGRKHSGHQPGTKTLIKKLNLNDAQKQAFQEIRRNHFTKMRKLKTRLRDAQHDFFEVATQAGADSSEVAKYRAEISDLQNQITDLSLDFFKQMLNELNPEQQEIMRDYYRNKYNNRPINQKKVKP